LHTAQDFVSSRPPDSGMSITIIFLRSLGLVRSEYDLSVYILAATLVTIILLHYVDDILLRVCRTSIRTQKIRHESRPSEMTADIMTKRLPRETHRKHVNEMGNGTMGSRGSIWQADGA
jgi:hypothetical protein